MSEATTPAGEAADFDPIQVIRILATHNVRYLIIGGLAARLWGSPSVTYDLDICYARDPENLDRLAQALRQLGARLRGVNEEVPFTLDAQTLAAGDSFTFTTQAGPVDILASPAGSRGFRDLDRAAIDVQIGGLDVRVAALDDLIRMKRAAGRPKDLIELEVLAALREELAP